MRIAPTMAQFFDPENPEMLKPRLPRDGPTLNQQILDLVREHELSEFEIEHEGLRLKIRKDANWSARRRIPTAAPTRGPWLRPARSRCAGGDHRRRAAPWTTWRTPKSSWRW